MTVSPIIADPKRLRRLVAFVGPGPGDCLLDVGTGVMASAFTRRVHDLPREFNEWLIGGRSSSARIEHIRRLMVGAVEADLSGLRIHPVDDTILFTQQVAWIIAEKPA